MKWELCLGHICTVALRELYRRCLGWKQDAQMPRATQLEHPSFLGAPSYITALWQNLLAGEQHPALREGGLLWISHLCEVFWEGGISGAGWGHWTPLELPLPTHPRAPSPPLHLPPIPSFSGFTAPMFQQEKRRFWEINKGRSTAHCLGWDKFHRAGQSYSTAETRGIYSNVLQVTW